MKTIKMKKCLPIAWAVHVGTAGHGAKLGNGPVNQVDVVEEGDRCG